MINNIHISKKTFGVIIVGLMGMFFYINPVSASEGAKDWRPTYDVIMMWVNFSILAGVLYKFLKTPLRDFLQGKKLEMAKELQRAEDMKQQAEIKIQEAKRMLEEGLDRFSLVKERIIQQGEKRKQQIIEEAEQQSQYMLIEAKRKVDSQIIRAREKYRAELVDTAFDVVLERIPQLMTAEDSERLIQNYIISAIPTRT